MQYNPKDLDPKAGTYKWIVIGAEDKISSKNEPYIKLKLAVAIPGRDEPMMVYPILHPKFLKHVAHFCKCAGIDFEQGRINCTDCISAEGWAAFVPDERGFLQVDDYLPDYQPPTPEETLQPAAPSPDGDIPF
jgi:hypothetical protein